MPLGNDLFQSVSVFIGGRDCTLSVLLVTSSSAEKGHGLETRADWNSLAKWNFSFHTLANVVIVTCENLPPKRSKIHVLDRRFDRIKVLREFKDSSAVQEVTLSV